MIPETWPEAEITPEPLTDWHTARFNAQAFRLNEYHVISPLALVDSLPCAALSGLHVP